MQGISLKSNNHHWCLEKPQLKNASTTLNLESTENLIAWDWSKRTKPVKWTAWVGSCAGHEWHQWVIRLGRKGRWWTGACRRYWHQWTALAVDEPGQTSRPLRYRTVQKKSKYLQGVLISTLTLLASCNYYPLLPSHSLCQYHTPSITITP